MHEIPLVLTGYTKWTILTVTGKPVGKTSFFIYEIIYFIKRPAFATFKHCDDHVRKSLVTTKPPWGLHGSSLVPTLADGGGIFRVPDVRTGWTVLARHLRGEKQCGPTGKPLVEEPSWRLQEEL